MIFRFVPHGSPARGQWWLDCVHDRGRGAEDRRGKYMLFTTQSPRTPPPPPPKKNILLKSKFQTSLTFSVLLVIYWYCCKLNVYEYSYWLKWEHAQVINHFCSTGNSVKSIEIGMCMYVIHILQHIQVIYLNLYLDLPMFSVYNQEIRSLLCRFITKFHIRNKSNHLYFHWFGEKAII